MAARDSLQHSSHVVNPLHLALRRQLEQRRKVLATAAKEAPEAGFMRLLHEVDAALDRMAAGRYGVCELCHDTVEDERLIADPLVRFCLCELSKKQQDALERDLELAAQIQARMLPKRDFRCDGWHVAYHYKPLGVVSGDYCDLIVGPAEQLYFMVGDVSGKGVAASMLMSNLSAIFRALIPLGLPLAELMERANSIFTGSTLPNQFATLICGRAQANGTLELCSAGHVPALIVAGDEVHEVESQGLPIGLFAEQKFTSTMCEFAPESSLVLFSDGVSEARVADEDYGYARIAAAVMKSAGLAPGEVVANCVRDLDAFVGSELVFDDQTLMVVQKSI
jgi:sigma-B regulation protein RsbU (phosphoserine phosphatase)